MIKQPRDAIELALKYSAAYVLRLPPGIEWFICGFDDEGIDLDVVARTAPEFWELALLFNHFPNATSETIYRKVGALTIQAYMLTEEDDESLPI